WVSPGPTTVPVPLPPGAVGECTPAGTAHTVQAYMLALTYIDYLCLCIHLLYAPLSILLRNVTYCHINRFRRASPFGRPLQGGEKMRAVWAQRQEELLSDCVVSPFVFDHMVDRLCDFAAPYQHCLETEAAQRNVQLYLGGLLSNLDRKNAEEIA